MNRYLNSFLIVILTLFSFNTIFAKENWSKVESPNFILFGSADEKEIKKVALKLEQFRATLALLLPRAKLNNSLPTNVYVFKNHDDFKPFKPLRNGKINENVAGYFFKSTDANYIALSTEARGQDIYNIIFHEYFHFVMENNLDNAPIWLNEGLAEYYSTFENFDDNSGANIGKYDVNSLRVLKSRDILPLEKFFALKQGTKDYEKYVKEGIFYPQSWAIVHFLLNGNQEARKDQFYKFVYLLNSGLNVEKSFQESFQADYKQIEKELRLYLGKLSFPYVKYTFKEKIAGEQSFAVTKLSEAEMMHRKGDLLLYSEQPDKSEKFLNDSIQLNQNSASSQISLGKLNLRLKKYSEARKNFENAVKIEPDNYLSHYYLAGFYSAEKDFDAAIKSFQKAIELKSDVPRIFFGLSSVFQEKNNYNEAVSAIEKAIRIDPRRASYHLTQSHLTLRTGKDSLSNVRAGFYLKYKGWKDESAPYAALNMYFANRRLNTNRTAQILEEALNNLDKETWGYSIFRYLNKEIDQNELLNLAVDNGKKTEANTYIGFELLLQGKTSEAKNYLSWVKTNGDRNFTEYFLSISLLEQMETPLVP